MEILLDSYPDMVVEVYMAVPKNMPKLNLILLSWDIF